MLVLLIQFKVLYVSTCFLTLTNFQLSIINKIGYGLNNIFVFNLFRHRFKGFQRFSSLYL